jgi:uncharacterized protein (TIGR01777 family)
MLPRTVAVAGANGMVGRHLVDALLARGARVIALVRSPGSHPFPPNVDLRRWQARDPVAPVGGADAIVNLVGNPIFAGAWTAARKDELAETRRAATRSLVEGLRKAGGEGRTFVSSSAVEYAGDTGDALVDETASPGKGFLAELAAMWEAEALRAVGTGARLVVVRQSLVLGREGGTLAAMLPIYRRGFGGTLGPGEQWMSWIHVEDAARCTGRASGPCRRRSCASSWASGRTCSSTATVRCLGWRWRRASASASRTSTRRSGISSVTGTAPRSGPPARPREAAETRPQRRLRQTKSRAQSARG